MGAETTTSWGKTHCGFVDTMQDPGEIDRQAASDLLSFMIGFLAHDQETGRTSS